MSYSFLYIHLILLLLNKFARIILWNMRKDIFRND